MFSLIVLFIVGIGLGMLLRQRQALRPWVERLIQVVVCALMLVLGISVGANPQVMQNLVGLGANALALTVGAVMGSILVVRALLLTAGKARR
jgi:uncharacterized membrane protein YbjE (DUF340 family)